MRRNSYVYLKMIDNVLYGVNANLNNDLSEIDVETGLVDSVLAKGEMIDDCMRPINLIEKYNNFLVLVDDAGQYIAFLNLDKKRDVKYFYINMNVYNLAYPQYIFETIHKEKLYLFSAFEDSVYVFDLVNNICERKRSLFGGLESKKSEKIFVYGFRNKNSVNLIKNNGNVCTYDLETEETKEKKMNLNTEIINAIQKNDIIYCLSLTGQLWKISDGGVEEVALNSREKKMLAERKVWTLAVTDKLLYCFPALGNKFIVYDLENEKLSCLGAVPKDMDNQFTIEGQYKYFLSSEDIENYYLANPTTQYILIVNKNNNDIKWVKPKVRNSVEDMDRLLFNMETIKEYEGALEILLEVVRRL